MDEFAKEFLKKPIFILSIGVRKSGKSYNALALIKHAMKKSAFDKYYMCLLVYDIEQTDSYDFVKKYKKLFPKKLTVLDRYTYLLTDKLLAEANNKKKKKRERTLIFVDDAMLSCSNLFDQQESIASKAIV